MVWQWRAKRPIGVRIIAFLIGVRTARNTINAWIEYALPFDCAPRSGLINHKNIRVINRCLGIQTWSDWSPLKPKKIFFPNTGTRRLASCLSITIWTALWRHSNRHSFWLECAWIIVNAFDYRIISHILFGQEEPICSKASLKCPTRLRLEE